MIPPGGLRILLLGWVLLASSYAQALQVPALVGHVDDQAGLLEPQTKQRLEQILTQYEQATGHQFAVLLIRSLKGEPIEDFSMRVVEAWKLGRKKHDDGLLLLVAQDDHRMRIEVGYGLEGDIPDALAGRIIRNVMVPHFRKQDFAGGISQALALLMKAGRGEAVVAPPAPRRNAYRSQGRFQRGIGSWFFPLLFVLPLFFPGSRRRRRGTYFGPWGGFGGGGLGGGGFGGGGGGFGGGGASGGW